MTSLSSELRNRLDAAVKTARQEAEKGARKALQTLAVDRHEPFGSMSVEDRELRNRLRARGRQLGDVQSQGTQRIDRLAHGIAYEHWHRMLFARFLAESGQLIEPGLGSGYHHGRMHGAGAGNRRGSTCAGRAVCSVRVAADLPYRRSSARLGTATRDSASARKAHR